jgi:hypothetical protein
MRFAFFRRGSHWLPTLLVLAVVLLAGARLITLSVNERAEQMRATAGALVASYSRSIEKQLQTLAERERTAGGQAELDQLLSKLQLNRLVNPEYDFELSKIETTGGQPRVFSSSRIDALDAESVQQQPHRCSR